VTRPPPAAATRSAGVGEVGACTICLDNDPLPIQSGCACRGDAGLAHVECRAMAAAHRVANSKSGDGWSTCGTCGQDFTGAMQLGLAEAWTAWWSTARRLPEEDVHRLDAANNLARALDNQGKHAEAETIYRDVLAVMRRVLGPEHPDTFVIANNLANALSDQGKHTEALTMCRELLVARRRVLGPEHPDALTTAGNLASALSDQGKHTEALTIYREVLAVE
jgi:hypothetical protein